MKIDRHHLLSRLNLGSMAEQETAHALLSAPDTQPVGTAPVRVSVSEARRLWRTRLANTQSTGANVHGLDALLERLRMLEPDEEIEQYGFVNERLAGNLFFDGRSGAFLGSAIVSTPTNAATAAC